ncbi:methionyl-tRNA formyltransferase [Butyricicoccus sp. AM05-1]|uniref:methionyl-tRNA formyltransferase n=1 Tax=Butyricicoccus sp. AM05-1 TaxID=2292004 RepID=UPI000E49C2D6|nr:methionyl-tRNA formyltransferase [Butyricicoccus sp. AM05-1]RHO62267.1 methionyl-tRNA formyltransferase [Butyricicoccus sp. AM05-1]
MRIVFMGTPDFAVPSLQALIDAGHDVCAVYTQPDKPQGRKQILTAPPVKTLALEHDIPVFQPNTLKNEDEQARLRELAPEVIIVVAYGKLLPKAVLDIPPHGCINVHGSLLPRWRGAAPIQWAVIAGDEMAGVTTMQMAEGLDTGDMLLTYETKVGAKETAGELFDRLAQSGAELLTQTLVKLDEITPRPQDDAQSCYAHMLDKQMAVIDWNKSAHEIDCLIRGLNPWPIALTTLSGERLKVFAAEKANGRGEPGTVLEADPKKGLTVACGEDALKLTEIQLVGGKRMKATDFLRGHAIEVGTKLN